MELEIIGILLRYSSELKTKSELSKEIELDDWLWAGNFGKVAHEIQILINELNDNK